MSSIQNINYSDLSNPITDKIFFKTSDNQYCIADSQMKIICNSVYPKPNDSFEISEIRTNNYLLKTNDSTEGWICTLPIMDKEFYQSQGYVYNPIYKHLFCDTELTHIADITGRLMVRNDIVFGQTFINDSI